jgi:anthranilate synthase component 2
MLLQNVFLPLLIMKILLLDNYDSFTYNLFHLVDQFNGVETDVLRNDEITVIQAEKYDRIIISPGPGLPSEAGITLDLIRKYFSSKPILGVCLGMQAMAEAFGGKLINLPRVFHGVSLETIITDKEEKLFKDIPHHFKSGRYHSWCVDKEHLPPVFRITAEDESGNLMAITHENQLLRGVQFHPESILTESGNILMANWLQRC